MADSKDYSIVGIGPTVQFGKAGGRIKFSTDHLEARNAIDNAYIDLYVPLTPGNAQAAASKSYVDSFTPSIDSKDSARAATTADGAFSTAYDNGSSIDGVALVTGDIILLKDQSDPIQNGIYTVSASGDPIRHIGSNTDAEVTQGAYCFVVEGTINSKRSFILTSSDPITVDTDAQVWEVTAGGPIGSSFVGESGTRLTVNNAETGVLWLGTDFKIPVVVATTADGTFATAYANGQTVDGIVLVTGDRILLKNQAATEVNGIYTVEAAGAPTRTDDFDDDKDAILGCIVAVNEGSTNAQTMWQLSNIAAVTLGVTGQTWLQAGGGGGGNSFGIVTGDTGTATADSATDTLQLQGAALGGITTVGSDAPELVTFGLTPIDFATTAATIVGGDFIIVSDSADAATTHAQKITITAFLNDLGIPFTGGTLSHDFLTLTDTPGAYTGESGTRLTVNTGETAIVFEGTPFKDPVAIATTADITLSGEQTIDGVLTSTDRILVKDQSLGEDNGIYVTAAGAWSRSDDFDDDKDAVLGCIVAVNEGTINAQTTFQLSNTTAITIGTTVQVWLSAGGGAATFLSLTDTPADYTDDALKVARVNAGETALEFVDPSIGSFGNPFSGALIKPLVDENTADYDPGRAIAFDAEDYDIGGWHDDVTNNTRLTVPAGVTKVKLNANVRTLSVISGDFQYIEIRKNGSEDWVGMGNAIIDIGSTGMMIHAATGTVNVIPGDYFELFLTMQTDDSITVVAARTSFSIEAVESVAPASKVIGPWLELDRVVKTVANASATVEFTFNPALYDDYEITITDAQGTSASNMSLRVSTDGGVTFDSGASSYSYIFTRVNATTSEFVGRGGDDLANVIIIADALSTGANQQWNTRIYAGDMTNNSIKTFNFLGFGRISDGIEYENHGGGSWLDTTPTDVNAFQILGPTTWDNGTFILRARPKQGVDFYSSSRSLTGMPFSGAMVKLDTPLTSDFLPEIGVIWESEEYDFGDWWAVGNATRLTVPAGVTKIKLQASIVSTGEIGVATQLHISKNGSGVYIGRSGDLQEYSGTTGVITVSSGVIQVVAGDYFEAIYQGSDDSITIDDTRSSFSIEAVEAIAPSTTPRGALVSLTADDDAVDYTSRAAVSWDQAEYDSDSIYAGGSPTRLTVPSGVAKVQLIGQVVLLNVSSTLTLTVDKNGSANYKGVATQRFANNAGDLVHIGTYTVASPGNAFIDVDMRTVTNAEFDGYDNMDYRVHVNGNMGPSNTTIGWRVMRAGVVASGGTDYKSDVSGSESNIRLADGTVGAGRNMIINFTMYNMRNTSSAAFRITGDHYANTSVGGVISGVMGGVPNSIGNGTNDGFRVFSGAGDLDDVEVEVWAMQSKPTTSAMNVSSPIIDVIAGDYFELFLESETDISVDLQSDRSTFAMSIVEPVIIAGLSPNDLSAKESVVCATTVTGALATVYENGDTIDAIVLATGDRILIKNQSTGDENGIYIVQASGAPKRSTDCNSVLNIEQGIYVFVAEGTANGATSWLLETNSPITPDVTAQVWVEVGASVAAGNSFGIVTGDTGTATADIDTDTLQMQGASTGGITTTGSDAPELITFGLTPIDLATTGATIVGGDFLIISDSADAATTLAQKVTWTSIIADLGLLTSETNAFGVVTGDTGTATSDTTNDTLQLAGATTGGITTIGTDAPELITFSITPIDLATTGATIVGGDFMIVSDSADTTTTVAQKVTWTSLIADLGILTSETNAFGVVTGDTGTATSDTTNDTLQLAGATSGGITTVGSDAPELVTFSITPVDLATTGATIAGGDFLIVSDSADTATTVGQKVTLTSLFNDMGVPFTGGTLAHNFLTLTDTPSSFTGESGTRITTNNAEDALVFEGTPHKDPCAIATTGNITLSAEQTIDGVLTATDRVLVKAQSSGAENGIYISAAGAWTRSDDFDDDKDAVLGLTVAVNEGSTQAQTLWQMTNITAVTVGSTIQVWAEIGAAVAGGFSYGIVTGDSGTATADISTDTLQLQGATTGGITTVGSDAPELVTFSITPVDLATTGATIAAGDFFIVSDSADAATTVAQKVTFTSALNDLGVPFTGGTLDAADYLLLAGGTMTGALIADDAGLVATPDIAWTGDPDTGLAQIGVANTLSIVGQGAVVAEFDGTATTPVNYITFASSATANTPIISNAGTDTNGVGLGLTLRGKTATATGNGGAIVIEGGDGNDTGVGGALTLTAGDSAGASGTAGSVTIDAGAQAGGATGSVTIAGTDGTLTLGSTAFPTVATAIGILALTAANTLAAVNATLGGATQQLLQFDDSGDTFSWIDKTSIGGSNGFGIITGDTGTATSDVGNDTLQMQGATTGGITTVGSDAPELVTFSITPIDLATTGATIAGGDFMIVSDSADAATTIAQKVTWTSIIADLGLLTAETNAFGIVTGDTGTATSDTTNDTLQLQGATSGGITTVGTDAPELVTFSITPIDLATTGATIAGGDFIMVSDSADAATTIAQKITLTAALNDLGVPFTGGTEDAADYLHLDGSTIMTGVATMADGGTAATPDLTWTGDLDTGMAQVGAANTLSIVGRGVEIARFDGVVASSVNFLTLTNSITGVAPIIGNSGTDTNGVGLGLAFTAKSATAAGAGGQLNLTGGAGDTGGAGGAVTLTGGVSGASGTGGVISLTGGASAGVSGTAGSIEIDAGALAGGAAGSVTIAGTNATTLTLGATSFPVASTAIGILALTAADTLTAVNATLGGATQQILQFDDSGDTFSWIDKASIGGGGNSFGVVTGDSGTATADIDTDTLQLQGAASGGIITVGSDAPELVTFGIVPVDLATTGATIAGGDFIIVSDSADTATVLAQKVTFTSALNDLGVPFTGGTEDAADYLHLDGSTIMTGVATMADGGAAATPDLTWTGDLDTGLAQVGVANTLSIIGGGVEIAQFIGTLLDDNFLTIASTATGVAPIISNSGTDTNGIGLGLAFTAKSATAAGAGGQLTLTGGVGDTGGAGGAITLVGGVSGASGTGGALNLTGGASAGVSGTAGSIIIDSGALAGGAGGTVTIANADAITLTLGQTSFPVASTAIGILALSATDTLTAINATLGGATQQLLQFDDSGDTFSWIDKASIGGGGNSFGIVTGDTGTATADIDTDTLQLQGAASGGITTVGSDAPELVTFSITPVDLATTGATIAGGDFIMVSDSADAATTVAQKITLTAALNDLGVPFTGGTEDAADYLHLDGSTIMTGVATMSDLSTLATPDLTWTGDLDTGLAQIGAANTLSIIGFADEIVRFDGTVTSATNFFSMANAATGTAPIMTNLGTDTNGVGLGLSITGKSATAAGAGGQLTLTGGVGDTGGAGGAVTLVGGVSGASGTGGALNLTGGASAGVSGTAGSVSIDSGALAGGAAGSVTIAGTNATTLTLGATSFPVASTAIGILALTATDTLTAVNATLGGATQQLLQFDDTGDTFSWIDKSTVGANGFGIVTGDSGTATSDAGNDTLQLQGATTGGITTVGSDAPELVTFSITPVDLATTGATIVGADFIIVSDSADAATTVAQKVTWTSVIADLGLATGGATIATVQTTNATKTNIATGALASGEVATIEASGQGIETATGDVYWFKIVGGVKNIGGTTAIVGTASITSDSDAGGVTWIIGLEADDAGDNWELTVTGEASHTIEWKVSYVEVLQ